MLFPFYLTYWHACHQLIGYKDMSITPLTTIEIKFACGSLHMVVLHRFYETLFLRIAVCSFKSCLFFKGTPLRSGVGNLSCGTSIFLPSGGDKLLFTCCKAFLCSTVKLQVLNNLSNR